MTRRAALNPVTSRSGASLMGEAYPVAAMICIIGFFMRLLLSQPVLNILGMDYGGDSTGFIGKVHPGSYLIILSFLVLLCSGANPFEQTIRIARQQTAFFTFVMIYLLITIFWALRGAKGIALIPDIHIVAPMSAIVFSYMPRGWIKRVVYGFAIFTLANSLTGLFEASTHLRIFPFNPEWEVLKQDYFRASAFMGHPLTNASFTAAAMFVVLDLRLRPWLKMIALLILLSSLVAFGGRTALIMGIIGAALLGLISVKNYFSGGSLTVLRLIGAATAILLVPVLCGGLLYGALHSSMGERLLAYSSLEDDSASVRLVALHVFDFMTTDDIIFGMDGQHVDDIGYDAGVAGPTSDIENPWILMFMFLGVIMFTLWLGGLGACLWRLMAGASPALKIALIEYFVIASSSNSFGRKDPVYGILIGIVLCAKQLKLLEEKRSETTL